MIALLFWGSLILIFVLFRGEPKPRVSAWRGTMWVPAEEAQRAHLDHFANPVSFHQPQLEPWQ